jgi:poly(A) polymerase
MTRVTGEWLTDEATQSVLAALESGGARALLVGGCVRNALLGAPVADIDIATDTRPERVIEIAQSAGIKAVPTGIDHGTVTLVAGGIPHEVTTFRSDIETDGRRAVVRFSDRMEEDAARRDFTMNALYADRTGEVLDPLGGLVDLTARRVRFIGDATARIAEDYLRSLRFFRFHAWYGDPAAGMDAEALAAIAGNLDGLDGLSHERVGAEMLKLLGAPDPAPSVAAMRSVGALARFLPGADDGALTVLVDIEAQAGAAPKPLRRLAVLGGENVAGTLRLSRKQARYLADLVALIGNTAGAAEIAWRYGEATAIDTILLRCALMGQPWPGGVLQEIEQGASARFPVRTRDLPDLRGAALGARLKALETDWIASGFTLDRDALLSRG